MMLPQKFIVKYHRNIITFLLYENNANDFTTESIGYAYLTKKYCIFMIEIQSKLFYYALHLSI